MKGQKRGEPACSEPWIPAGMEMTQAASTSPTTPTPAYHVVQHPRAGTDDKMLEALDIPARDAAGSAQSPRHTVKTNIGGKGGTRLSPVSPVTSRRRCFGQLSSKKGWQKHLRHRPLYMPMNTGEKR